MFRRLISRYGLAVHLALLVAAPTALVPFVPSGSLPGIVLWLSLFALIWMFAEPSVRAGESLSRARARVFHDILHDPIFYFFLIALMFAGARFVNSGLALAYDAERTAWTVGAPDIAIFPSAAAGCAEPLLVSLIVIAICSLALLHAVGLLGRLYFSLAVSFFSGCGGLASAWIVCSGGEGPLAEAVARGFGLIPSSAASYGVWFMVAVAAGIFAEARGWKAARIVYAIALAGNAIGLFFFSPALVTASYAVVALGVALFGFSLLSHVGGAGAVVRNIVFLALGVGGCVLVVMVFAPDTLASSKFAALDPSVAFPETYAKMSEALSRIAREMWMQHPWLGVGLGAFGLQLPFFAEKADWSVLPPDAGTALNGWWTLLAERGILGTLLLVTGLLLFTYTYIRRLVGAYVLTRSDPESDRLPFVSPPVVWIPFLTVALISVETVFSPVFVSAYNIIPAAVPLALAAASFPRASKKN